MQETERVTTPPSLADAVKDVQCVILHLSVLDDPEHPESDTLYDVLGELYEMDMRLAAALEADAARRRRVADAVTTLQAVAETARWELARAATPGAQKVADALRATLARLGEDAS